MEEIKKYVLVLWPYSQLIMDHPRFSSDCYLVQALEGQEYFDSAYFVPEDIYQNYHEEIMQHVNFVRKNYPPSE